MLRHPVLPNQRTLASLFKACVSLPHCLFFGLSLHALSFKLSLNTQTFSGSALVNFYSKYRLPRDATKVFDEMPQRDEVCYAAVIVGLAQNSKPLESLSLFAAMKSCNVGSTIYSVSGALRAVADMAALEQCRMMHEAFKYISRVIEQEIIVRDVNRYHNFLNGSCTCGDIW